MTLTMKPFYFIRHGQTDWNVDGRGMGQTDIPLNACGLQQARAAGQVLGGKGITLICHSPLSRAKRTAELIHEVLRVPLLEISELAECGWGVREGSIKGEWIEGWMAGEAIEGGELFETFLQRALAGINRALAHEGLVLIVAHGGVYWAVQKFARLQSGFAPTQNCVPIFHEPPHGAQGNWTTRNL